jgi:hypothetical protein
MRTNIRKQQSMAASGKSGRFTRSQRRTEHLSHQNGSAKRLAALSPFKQVKQVNSLAAGDRRRRGLRVFKTLLSNGRRLLISA